MANDTYEPENDTNLEQDLLEGDVYTPENSTLLGADLVSVIKFGTEAAIAQATGETIKLSGTTTFGTETATAEGIGGTTTLIPLEIEVAANKTKYSYSPSTAEVTVIARIVGANTTKYTYTPSTADIAIPSITVGAEKTPYTYTPSAAGFNGLFAVRDEVVLRIDGVKLESWQELEVNERLNEVDTFSFTAYIVDEQSGNILSEGNDMLMFENGEFKFKGRIENVDKDSQFQVTVEGEGMENKLLDRKTDREEYNNVPADQIVKDLIPSGTMSEGVIESAPLTSLSFEHDNLARAIAGAANAVGYDWEVSQKPDDNFETDYLDFVESQGEEFQ